MGRNGSRPPPKREVSKARSTQKNRPRPQPRVEAAPPPGPRPVPAPDAPPPPENRFPVVGVGASAGGLEAFSQLLRNLPSDTGMAFVLVQHLAAKHESILASILARETRMTVQEATEGVPLQPNHVYVIPPGQDMLVKDGHLGLQPRGLIDGRHLPFDLFLRSLADVQKSQAVAVVLSGTGNDGMLGCMAVKAAGGISIAQDPRSARYDGMPRSAIAAGCVDLVLPPDEIAREIQRLAGDEYLRPSAEREAPPAPDEDGKDAFSHILGLLRKGTGTDFSSYKKPTLLRRLRRRMALWKIERLGDYVSRLLQHPGELDALHQDFLINVTTFFRDPAAFATLANDVCPRLLHERSADSPVRVWIPGCANGEEAYSIAICLLEAVARTGAPVPIQIFGTDLSSAAILRARAGIYLESIAADVSPVRLERFFVKVDGSYQVSKAVRDMCVFAQHNLIRDPPFSRLDLVSCRNVLIYLEVPQQKRVLASFHYALKPAGFLFLGHSETVGATPLFDPVDKEQRVYTKRVLSPAPPPALLSSAEDAGAKPSPVRDEAERGWLHREADRAMLTRYGPAGVLVDDKLDILQFRGETAPYLEHLTGASSLNLLKMLRKGPLNDVREAIREARAQDVPARREVRLGRGQAASRLAVQVIPIKAPPPGRGRCFLVLFEGGSPRPLPPPVARFAARAQRTDPTRVSDLEDKLALSLQEQQALLEEQEAATEELQSAHEEVLSSNEELQSINEELETAKEELQSTNEELTTVNEELQNRNLELTQATDDMVNLLASLDVPIVMLGSDMQVRRFTPAAARLFNLIPGDVGRPLADLRGTIVMSDLEPSIRAAMDTLAVQTREVADADGRWYSLRVRPYKTGENRIDGVVMLFVDIDEMKKGVQRLDQSRAYAEAIVDTVGSPLLILNARLRVERANRSYYDMFRATPEETEGQALSELGGGLWDVADLRRRLADLPVSEGELKGLALEGEVPGKGARMMHMNARRLTVDGSEPARILVSIEDRTEEVRAQRERESLLAQEETATRQAQMASRLKDEFIATVSHELRGPLNAMAGWVHALGSGRLEPETMSRGLAALDRAVKSQTRLIEDLLDMSRIMSGKLRLANRFIDLAGVTRAALETATPAAQAKSIQMALQSPNEPFFVLGDPDRLQQVVWNLLSNAVKFTPRDGRVDVELLRKGTSTQLRITDTGQGISPEFLPHVFEPFRQADSSPARSYQGLGLGLAISRHLVESHGGIIRAESAGVGQGTTVTVLLPVPPLLGEVPSSEPAQHDAPPRVVPDRTLLDGLRVLIVEDEADSRDILAAVLREWGADVTTSASAPDALVVLDSRPPDVLVSDIGMPGMDGYELIRELRKRDAARGGRVPAIALTAYVDPESRSQAFAAGFEEHVAKPADPQALLAAVARLAGRRAPQI
jgi:two-component system, chemotaxis family, CheB/CheR fusion protein